MSSEKVNFNYMEAIYYLATRLKKANIPFEIKCGQGGFQIAYPKAGADRICSVILHNYSQGNTLNNFEICGLLTDEEEKIDNVKGNLTEVEVFYRIYDHYYGINRLELIEKKIIECVLSSSTNNIIKHLFKLYCMPDSIDRNRWINEIANFLDSVKKLSGKNKFPDSNQIYECTYDKWENLITDIRCISGMIETIEFEYNIVIDKDYNFISNEFNSICKDYFMWISNELSQKGIIGHRTIYNKINELL